MRLRTAWAVIGFLLLGLVGINADWPKNQFFDRNWLEGKIKGDGIGRVEFVRPAKLKDICRFQILVAEGGRVGGADNDGWKPFSRLSPNIVIIEYYVGSLNFSLCGKEYLPFIFIKVLPETHIAGLLLGLQDRHSPLVIIENMNKPSDLESRRLPIIFRKNFHLDGNFFLLEGERPHKVSLN